MIVDVHHHLVCESGYVDGLLRAMDAAGIEKTGLIAMGPLFEHLFVTTETTAGPTDERHILAAMRAHPDRFFGYVYVRLGDDGPEKVRRWADEGFLGVKFHIPRAPYHHDSYFPVYEAARALDLVCLFHTGLFYLPSLVGQKAASEYTRPAYVEAVLNELPDLKVLLGHMGGVWAEEACGMMRIHRNCYADMSGRLDGWKKAKPMAWFKEMLFWPTAQDKVLFGTDVHHSEIPPTIEQHRQIVDGLGWGETGWRKLVSENARKLFRF